MQRLLRGLRIFQESTFKKQKGLYQKLSTGQNPEAMFITCADSRIVPSTLTQTGPGDLFIVRNAGNFVSPNGSGATGEGASLEFAVLSLKIPDIIVCGHTDCGAINHLMTSAAGPLPILDGWVNNAREIVQLVLESAEETRLANAYRQNVLLQLRNLLSYPFVAKAVERGELKLHGWLYDVASGEVLACNPMTEDFSPITGGEE